jgi:hypothetical protein
MTIIEVDVVSSSLSSPKYTSTLLLPAMTLRAIGSYTLTWTPPCSTSSLLLWTLVSPFYFSYFILFSKRIPIMIDITSSVTYNTSAPWTNNGTVDGYHDVNDTALVPIVPSTSKLASKGYLLNFAFDTTTDGTFINRVTFNYPLVPAVLSELSLGSNAAIQQAMDLWVSFLSILKFSIVLLSRTRIPAVILFKSIVFFFHFDDFFFSFFFFLLSSKIAAFART